MAIATGSAVYQATFEGLIFDMYTYRPSGTIKGILFVHHGNQRNAADYRTYAIKLADHQKLVVVAPYFDATRFDNNAYHRGNIINEDTGAIRPQSQWTPRFIPLMAAWARSEVGPTLPYYLWGHSAGGQFVSRVAAFGQPPAVRLVAANPSTHVLPQIGVYPSGEKAPYGMGLAFPANEEVGKLKSYVGMPLTLYQGGNDVDPSDPDLSRGDAPDRQGLYRLERGLYTYAMGQQVATNNGWRFGWKLVVGPEIAHDGELMLMSRRVLDALGRYDTEPVFRIAGQSGTVSLRLRFRGFNGRIGTPSTVKTAASAAAVVTPQNPVPFGSTNQTASLRGEDILLYLRRPACANPGNGLFVIWHGTNRNSDNYILHGTDWTNARCVIGVAPTMDETRFPTSDYQLGGLYPPNSSTLRSSDQWIVNYSQAVVDWARNKEERPTMPVWQFGHSAGGQFLSRVAAYACPPGMQRILVANPSSHVRATLNYNAPYGFGNLPSALNPTQMLINYLAQPITIFNGSADNDPNDPDLSQAAGAVAQGSNRLARAQFVWDEAVATANSMGVPFNWRKVVAQGVVHDAYDMLHSPEMAQAWAP